MAARKRAAKKAEQADTADEQGSTALEQAAKSTTAVEPVATKDGVPTYRTDLGESLPPQKKAGVE